MQPEKHQQNKEMQNQDNVQRQEEIQQPQQQANQQRQQDMEEQAEGQGQRQEGDDDGQGDNQQQQLQRQQQPAQQGNQKQGQQIANQPINEVRQASRQVSPTQGKDPIQVRPDQPAKQHEQKFKPSKQSQVVGAKILPSQMIQQNKVTRGNKPQEKQFHHQMKKKTQNERVQTVEVKPSLISPITQSQKQKYINTLQNNLKQRQMKIKLLTSKTQQQSIKISSLQQKNTQISQNLEQLKKSSIQSERYLKIKQRSLQEATQKVQNLEKELVSYRQVGDIRVLLRKVQQLQGLVQAQKNQISIIKQYETQRMINEAPQRKFVPRQYIQRMQLLQNQKQQRESEIKQLNYKIEAKNKQNQQINQIMNNMDASLKNNIQKISSLEEQMSKRQKTHQAEKHTLQQKIKILQKFIQIQTGKNRNSSSQQQMEQENNTNLQKERQKNIVFREYLKLQLDHQTLQQAAKDYKTKYHQTYKQLQKVKKQMVTKKDYQQILLRYKKCKLCLQKSIKQNKQLRCSSSSSQIANQGDNSQIKNGNSIGLTQQQNNMKRYMEVLNEHIITAIDLSKQTNKITSDMHINKIRDQLKEKQKQVKQLQEKCQRLQRFNNMFEKQLVYKNSFIDKLLKDGKILRAQYNKSQDQRLQYLGQLADCFTAKSALNRLQSKSSALLIRNRKLLAEKDQWKSLYQQIKAKYETFISRDPYIQAQDQKSKKINQETQKMMQQGQIGQQKVEQKKVNKPPKSLLTTQTQTQGLNQLYYKQIKETLSALKKFPQLIKKTTADYERIGKDLQEYKKRYDQVNLKYNMKFRQLQNEKSENDLWRENAKKQIINEFQDIRDLVQNERLLACLRKAKNLIQYLEQGQQEEEQGEAAPQ